MMQERDDQARKISAEALAFSESFADIYKPGDMAEIAVDHDKLLETVLLLELEMAYAAYFASQKREKHDLALFIGGVRIGMMLMRAYLVINGVDVSVLGREY